MINILFSLAPDVLLIDFLEILNRFVHGNEFRSQKQILGKYFPNEYNKKNFDLLKLSEFHVKYFSEILSWTLSQQNYGFKKSNAEPRLQIELLLFKIGTH